MIEIGADAGKFSDNPELGCARLDEFKAKFERYSDLVDRLVAIDAKYDTEARDSTGKSLESVEIDCARMGF